MRENDILTQSMLLKAAEEVYKMEQNLFGKKHGFYDGREIFHRKDSEKKEPVCYIVTNNRTAGKTSFLALFSYKIKEMYGLESLFLVRGVTETDNYHRVYSDMSEMYGLGEPNTSITMRNLLNTLQIGGETIAHVASLKKYVQLKKFSPIFAKVGLVLMDEYQLEDGRFIKDEISAFHSICRTADRGGGKISKGIKILMMGNPVELLNPYLLEFGISEKYAFGMSYVSSPGVLAEFKLNLTAQSELQKSGLSRLFNNQNEYDFGISFLYDDTHNMGKCKGKSSYMFTLCYGTSQYGVRKELTTGYVHIGGSVDPHCKKILAFREQDRFFNIGLLEKRDYTWNEMREAYKLCKLKFENFKAKKVIFQLLGVDKYE